MNRSRWTALGLAAVTISVAVVMLGGVSLPGPAELLARLERAQGPEFLAVGLVWMVLALPASIPMAAAGFVFGPVLGALVGWLISVVGSALGFAISRTALRGPVRVRVARSQRFAAIEREVERRGTPVVALLRLSPVFPFNLISYGLGVTAVRSRSFVLGTAMGVAPVCVLNAVIGAGVHSLARIAEGAPPPPTAAIVAGLLTVLATVGITRQATRMWREVVADGTLSADQEPSLGQ